MGARKVICFSVGATVILLGSAAIASISGVGTVPLLILPFLCALSLIDIKERIVPNYLLIAGLFGLLPVAIFDASLLLKNSLISLIIGSLMLALTLLSKDGLGMGDVKLVALIALYLGWNSVTVLFFGCMLATITGFFLTRFTREGSLRNTYLPLVPFLAGGFFIEVIVKF